MTEKEELVKLEPNDSRWLALINRNPAATIFHHPAWMELLSACYGYHSSIFSVLDGNGQICAGLPIAEVKIGLTPRRYVALPFSDYCSPLFSDEGSLSLLISELIKQQQAKSIPKVEIRSGVPVQEGIQACSPFVIHNVPLEADFDQVARRANRQQKQNVQTAEKNGIRVVQGTGLKEVSLFYHLHCLSRRKHGVPVQPWNFFQLLTKLLLERGLGFVLLAYQEDRCISGGFFLHWQKTLTYKYSATDEVYQNLRPNHLVTWTAMKWGSENGYTNFDFGRADLEDEGLRSYKRRWGANEDPLTYSYIPSAPADVTGGNGKLGNLLKEVIRRSPLWVCRLSGQLLYRYFG